MSNLKDILLYNIRDRIDYWVHRHDPYLTAVVMSGLLTLTFLGLLFLSLFLACKQVYPNAGQPSEQSVVEDAVHVGHYVSPGIPEILTDPQERASYYVTHYWEGYSLSDTAFIRSNDTEQLYVNFIDALQYAEAGSHRSAMENMMSLMESDSVAYAHFCMLGEKYLYNAGSPVRNEEYYIPVLEHMLGSIRLTEADKIRPSYHLKQAQKNRLGMVASDFSYVTPEGKSGRLSRIKADYTLLFFYNPGCSSCHEYEQVLSGVPALLELQEKGRFRVLAVYPDADENEWLLNVPEMPEGWIVGWNRQGDINEVLYDIRAIPTLYLLDGDKRVLLKDASLEQVIGYFTSGSNYINV